MYARTRLYPTLARRADLQLITVSLRLLPAMAISLQHLQVGPDRSTNQLRKSRSIGQGARTSTQEYPSHGNDDIPLLRNRRRQTCPPLCDLSLAGQ